MSDDYATIREHIGFLIGKKLIDITQHDKEDYDPETNTGGFAMLLFEDGSWIKFYFGAPAGEVDFEFEQG